MSSVGHVNSVENKAIVSIVARECKKARAFTKVNLILKWENLDVDLESTSASADNEEIPDGFSLSSKFV